MATESVENQGIKLTEQELKMLSDLEQKKILVNNEVSYLAQQQLHIDLRKDKVKEQFRQNADLERQIANTLTEKYGNGAIDVKSGTFIPS